MKGTTMGNRLLLASLMAVSSLGMVAGQVRVPGVSRSLPLPGISAWINGEPALTMSIADARIDVPFLDKVEARFEDLQALRNSAGRFTMRSGNWTTELHSFCLFPGSRGPRSSDGQGYLLAPLRGSRAAVVQKLLDRYGELPDIPQPDMQMLLWGVAAKARIRQMAAAQQRLAARLLTPLELAALDRDALGVIPPALRQRVYNALPREARALAEAENNLRELLGRANATYAELERVAVLGGPEPAPERSIARGRWSIQSGMLVRLVPSVYSRTTLQLSVPSPYRVVRDGLGRIVRIDFGEGRTTETDYDDTIPPFEPPGVEGIVGYAIRAVRMTRPGPDGGVDRWQVENAGWTFVNRVARRPAAQFGFMRASFGQTQLDRFRQWKERYDRFNTEYRQRAEWYKQRWNTNVEPPPDVDQVLRDLEDMQHYRSAVEAVISGGPAGQLAWLIEHQERMNNALRRATIAISRMGEPSREFSPSGNVAVPGHRGSQRLGMSARRAGG